MIINNTDEIAKEPGLSVYLNGLQIFDCVQLDTQLQQCYRKTFQRGGGCVNLPPKTINGLPAYLYIGKVKVTLNGAEYDYIDDPPQEAEGQTNESS